MKRFLKYILIIAVVLFSSCTKQDELDYQQGQDVEYIVTHVKEDNSKTSIDNHGYIYWSPNETINVFYGSTSIKFKSMNKVKQTSAVFVGTQPFYIGENEESFLMPVMGLYPYDSLATCTDGTICTTFSDYQEAVDSSFAEKSFPTIAQTTIDDYILSFYNICGGLKFTVGKSGIKKVIISGNNGENIAGKIKVCFGENGVPAVTEVSEGKTEITLSSSLGLKTGTPYYIAVLPTVFSNGLTIRLETDNMYAEKTYGGKREIKRSVFADLSQVDSQLQWNKKPSTPLTFTSTGSTSIALKYTSSNSPTVKLQYKKNNGNWDTYNIGTEISLSDGELVSFQAANGGNSTFSSSYNDYYNFTMSGDGFIAASGNIMSLLDNTLVQTAVPDYCFVYLFSDCSSLSQAPNLPATTLAERCYSAMFSSTSLTQAPELPATTLAEYCYSTMFSGCTSLTQAPELPATTLAEYCYSAMFGGCTSLTQAPELPATTLAKDCYVSMFGGCTSLTQAPELPAITLASYCYSRMFVNCTSLTQAPEIHATTLAAECCRHMFDGCTSLATAPKLPATTLATNCYYSMFKGCTGLTTVPDLSAITLAKDCCVGMFEDCTSLKQAPGLPATTLVDGCYNAMFYGCTSLTQAPKLPATTLATSCYSSMFQGCTSLIQAPELPATMLATYCYSWMFGGCTSLTQAPELPAMTLVHSCYEKMFNGCTNLNHVICKATDISASSCCWKWLEGVSFSGTFVKASGVTWSSGVSGIPSGWTIQVSN